MVAIYLIETFPPQRKTQWAPYHEVKDFIDPANPGQTVEGIPLPQRVILTLK